MFRGRFDSSSPPTPTPVGQDRPLPAAPPPPPPPPTTGTGGGTFLILLLLGLAAWMASQGAPRTEPITPRIRESRRQRRRVRGRGRRIVAALLSDAASERSLARPQAEAIDRLVDKYMALLGVRGDRPDIAVRDNLGSTWLGRCSWAPSRPATSLIELQRSILADSTTLERVLAHEMIHHRDFLAMSGAEIAMARMGIRPAGHGGTFLEGAAAVNAVMGSDFVTVKSDMDYKQAENTREFFVIAVPIDHERLGWAWAARLSPKGSDWVKRKISANGAKIFRTKDVRWTSGPRIGDGGKLAIPSTGGDAALLRSLYEDAPPAELN